MHGAGWPLFRQAKEDKSKFLWQQVSRSSRSSFDLALVCCGGEILECDSAVLASASSFLGSLLRGVQLQARDGSWLSLPDGNNGATLILDQVKAKDLRRLLCLLYNGYADVTLDAAADLKDVWKHLDIDIVKLQQPLIDVVDHDDLVAQSLRKDATHFLESSATKLEPIVSLEEVVVPGKLKMEGDLEDPDEDPDEPGMFAGTGTGMITPQPVKKLRGPASKRKNSPLPIHPQVTTLPGGTKKMKAEGGVTYTVEEVHICKLCHGRDKDGKVDKEALTLSFKEMKKLVGHYGKHLYDEGKMFKYIPLGPDNIDRGQGFDEFGKTYRYKCGFKSCWKAAKGECGYKEFALHMISDHEALEKALEEDSREVLQELLLQIKNYKIQQRIANQPKLCVIGGCRDSDKEHIKENDYKTLKQHYAVAHYRRWFERPAAPGQGPRTQKLSKTGTICHVCQLKLFGDDDRMIEHYAIVHDRLIMALKDEAESGVPKEQSRAVIEQVFPSQLPSFDKRGPGRN